PGCKYLIQLRAEGNDHIERALPQHRAIEVGSSDIEGVNIIAFRQINQFDLSGNIITETVLICPLLFGFSYRSSYFLQRKVPDQDVAQGSYIALPLTLLLLLAAYNHEKLVSRVQGVRSMAQTSTDSAALEEAKRQAKRQKARRT
ncbi:hypothetical protein GOODEAATRI_010438, partial [Goodea atripinnis]